MKKLLFGCMCVVVMGLAAALLSGCGGGDDAPAEPADGWLSRAITPEGEEMLAFVGTHEATVNADQTTTIDFAP